MICGRSCRFVADPLALKETLFGDLTSKGIPVSLAPFTPTSGDTEIWQNTPNRFSLIRAWKEVRTTVGGGRPKFLGDPTKIADIPSGRRAILISILIADSVP